MSGSICKYLTRFHESLQAKQHFPLEPESATKFKICEEDKRLIEELRILGQKTLNEQKEGGGEGEHNQLLDLQENGENGCEEESKDSVKEEVEYIPSIKQSNSQNVSMMKVSDLNIRELCNLNPNTRPSKSKSQHE